MGGKRKKKKSLNPNESTDSPIEKRGKRNSNASMPIPVPLIGSVTESDRNSNRFAILSDEEEDQVPADEGSSSKNQRPLKQKLPPLVVQSVPIDKLKRTMQAIGIIAEYQLTRMGAKIITNTREAYNKAKTYLSKANIGFYTHDVAAEKPFKAVIRGLPMMKPDEILVELRDKYKLQPLVVYPMNRRNQTQTYRDCLYLVHFTKGTATLGALQAIRSINSVIVKWEAYKGPTQSVTQCLRCLNFGHGTRNCFMLPKCNVCCEQHLTENCNLENSIFKCANCGGAHKSTDRTCSKREEYRRIRMEASKRNQPHQLKKRKHELIDLDTFPELPVPRTRMVPNLEPLPFPNQPRKQNETLPVSPPGFNPESNQWFPSYNIPNPRSSDPTTNTIAQLASLVAELQKMMMQMMQFFVQLNIHHPIS